MAIWNKILIYVNQVLIQITWFGTELFYSQVWSDSSLILWNPGTEQEAMEES